MADRDVVANKDGPFKTNLVEVEPGYLLVADYTLVRFSETQIEPTGRLKVIGIFPSSAQSTAPRFLGRWDEKEQQLDFDPVDGRHHVDKSVFDGHHTTRVGNRRFEVELRKEERRLIFRGVVSIALGIRAQLAGETLKLTESLEAKLIRKPAGS